MRKCIQAYLHFNQAIFVSWEHNRDKREAGRVAD